jgi:hypothetical protein
MTELGPSARALLDAARPGMSPDAAAIKRMRAKVDATVAGGTAAGFTAAKVGLFGLVCALAIGIGIYASRAGSVDAPPRIDLPSTRSETSAPPVVRPVADDPGIEMDAMPMTRPRTVSPRVETRPTAAIATPAARIDLAREVELIDQAMAALRGNDPAGALKSIHTHATETRGAGQLAEDAAAIEVEALCRLHDPTVATKLEAFDARFPRSAQRSRLTNSCH